jgi:hypothetical protein
MKTEKRNATVKSLSLLNVFVNFVYLSGFSRLLYICRKKLLSWQLDAVGRGVGWIQNISSFSDRKKALRSKRINYVTV